MDRRRSSSTPTKSKDFPTSPQSIIHFSHPQHLLSQVSLYDIFTCMVCKEFGAGNRFTCRQCDFQIHDFCTLSPPALNNHPLHCQHQLLLNSKSGKGGMVRSKCDICAKPCKGHTFQCTACSFQMHPSCAMLSSEINLPLLHPHKLLLLPDTMTTLANGTPTHDYYYCGQCMRKRSGRMYRCPTCNYQLHAVCAKNVTNGMHANGFMGQEKPSMFGAAARLLSKGVIDFIGGLIEGIGEGVGEVLIQTMVKGRCMSRRRR